RALRCRPVQVRPAHRARLRPAAPQRGEILPQKSKTHTPTYPAAQKLVEGGGDRLGKAGATPAGGKDDKVKLPLRVGLIKIDPLGQGKPVSAAILMGRMEMGVPREQVEKFVIGFDRGDVCWLRGYCHFLAAWGEVLLSVDGKELFDCT